MKEHVLIGKTITAIYLADDNGAIRFDVADGLPIVARAHGDCCSYTWIESIDAPESLVGGSVKAVENVAMPDLGNGDSECRQYYGCKITTDKGAAVIDYRNDSNGYYGGSLEWPGGHYYGGVYKQNVSKERWKKVV